MHLHSLMAKNIVVQHPPTHFLLKGLLQLLHLQGHLCFNILCLSHVAHRHSRGHLRHSKDTRSLKKAMYTNMYDYNLCMYIYVCTYILLYVVYIYICMYICMKYLCMYIYIYVCMIMYDYMYDYMIYIYVLYMYVCINVYVCMYIHISILSVVFGALAVSSSVS